MMNLTIDKTSFRENWSWRISGFYPNNTLIREVNENMDKFEMGIAASKIYDFIWDSTATGISN